MKDKIRRITLSFILIVTSSLLFGQSQSELVYFGQNGKLEYKPYSDRGDIIPDFSNCGYMGGGVAIPDLPIVAVVESPSKGDDTPVIQSVINSVSKLSPDKNGFRGAILIKRGVYNICMLYKI